MILDEITKLLFLGTLIKDNVKFFYYLDLMISIITIIVLINDLNYYHYYRDLIISIITIIVLIIVLFSIDKILSCSNSLFNKKNKPSNSYLIKRSKHENYKNKEDLKNYNLIQKNVVSFEKKNTFKEYKNKQQNFGQSITRKYGDKDNINSKQTSNKTYRNPVNKKEILQKHELISTKVLNKASNTIEENIQLITSIPSSIIKTNKSEEEFTEINQILHNTLAKIEIRPQQIQLLPKEKYKFEVLGYDFDNQEIILDKIVWKCSKGGKINSQGVFKGGYTKQKVIITVESKGVKSFAEVILIPVVRDLVIIPQNITLKHSKEQQFSCQAIDQYGNIINIERKNISWNAVGGEITSDGVLTLDEENHQTCLITVKYIPYSKAGNYNLFSLGISLKLLSYILSLNVFQNSLEEIISDPDKTTNWIKAILSMLSGNGFNFDLQTWLIMQIINLISNLLNMFIEILLNEQAITSSVVLSVTKQITQLKSDLKPQLKSKEAIVNFEQDRKNIEIENKEKHEFDSNEPTELYKNKNNKLNKISYDSTESKANFDEPTYDSYCHDPEYYEELLKDSYSYKRYSEYLYFPHC